MAQAALLSCPARRLDADNGSGRVPCRCRKGENCRGRCRTVSIFLSSGEASGDHYTASVARELRKLGYEGDIWGMGGKEPREAGVRVEWPGEELQLMGIAEVLTSIPSLYRRAQ